MNAFQYGGLALVAAAVVAVLVATSRRRLRKGVAALWILLWAAAGVAMARPGLTVHVATWLGISRGADLVFYCGILGMLAGFLAIYLRLRRIERTLTLIVRHVALDEAPGPPPEDGADRLADG